MAKKYYNNAPMNDYTSYGVYSRILSDKIKDPNVYNIGVIAPYGAGKSSLIETYKNNEGANKKILTISLASFNESLQTSQHENLKEKGEGIPSENKVETNQYDENKVELSILQQIIYSKKSSRFPRSQISRIKKSSIFKAIMNSVMYFISILSIIMAAYYYLISNYNLKDSKFLFCSIVALIFIFIIIFVYCFNRKGIAKIKLFEIEAEFSSDKELSVLNRFIDELIYFFSQTKINILIIEDLDRFNDLSIFTKLREINKIINSSELVHQKVTFVYCVKDELFENELDRAKFFEYVLSLIPILSAHNVRDCIMEFNNQLEEEMRLSLHYINEIRFFINDFRLLKNTFNDYQLFWEKLQISSFNHKENKNEKLFSMMLYKNIDPKGFAGLQKNEGRIVDIFRNKKIYYKKHIDEINANINEFKEEIKQAESLFFSSFNQLKHLIKGHLIEMGSRYTTYFNNGTIEVEDLETFSNKNETIGYRLPRGYCYEHKLSTVENRFNIDYYQLEKQILEGKDNVIKRCNNEITKSKSLINNLHNLTLSEFINDYGSSSIFLADDSKLLIYLVSNGYISEDYLDFAVLASSETLTSIDREFISNVLIKQNSDITEKLTYIDNILNELEEENFEKEYVLNLSLVNYLFKYYSESKKMQSIINLLALNNTKNYEFLQSYFMEYSYDKFLILLTRKNNIHIFNFLNKNDIDDLVKYEIVLFILSSKNQSMIDFYNQNNLLCELISSKDPSYYDVKENYEILINLGVKFEHVTSLSISEMEIIINNNLYAINYENINNILNAIGRCTSISNVLCFMNANNYIVENIDKVYRCFQNINLDSESDEQLKIILALENFSFKEELLEKIDNKFNNLDDFDDETLKLITKNNRYYVNWQNLNLLLKKGFEINYEKIINENVDSLANENIDPFEIRSYILKLNINCEILKAYHEKIIVEEIIFNDDNLLYLINEEKIQFNDLSILNNYSNSLIRWYELHIEDWNLNSIAYNIQTTIALMNSKISSTYVEQYITKYSKQIIESGKVLEVYNAAMKNDKQLPDDILMEVLLRSGKKVDILKEVYEQLVNKESIKNTTFLIDYFNWLEDIKELSATTNISITLDKGDNNTAELLRFLRNNGIVSFNFNSNKTKISHFHIK